MNDKFLGKIASARFGKGGYDDAMFGLDLTFTGEGLGVSDFVGWWDMEPGQHAKWTVADRDRKYLEAANKLRETLTLAKKKSIQDLVGVPVEVTIVDNRISGWRVLTEVL